MESVRGEIKAVSVGWVFPVHNRSRPGFTTVDCGLGSPVVLQVP